MNATNSQRAAPPEPIVTKVITDLARVTMTAKNNEKPLSAVSHLFQNGLDFEELTPSGIGKSWKIEGLWVDMFVRIDQYTTLISANEAFEAILEHNDSMQNWTTLVVPVTKKPVKLGHRVLGNYEIDRPTILWQNNNVFVTIHWDKYEDRRFTTSKVDRINGNLITGALAFAQGLEYLLIGGAQLPL
ncbi:hypothetical protein B0T26DRAFT_751814 [Lasiosphaeria miniovina]|uniref:Uncharacterized protein n=1 Tax=Lasiosphaeria miniovina TaxID=1954250 RepID=A0AA40AL90_9PEZI|nr:uncharacterized protein B0T26DRAFT_751814 [Lasiosphaeria miniovina]KAK0717792.1 hypothetical protein B0T26DRAFT_751814 [Lasiosphaeria miniovina]